MNNKKTILIVDDDKNFSDIVSAKLETVGFNVIMAVNGEDGIEKIKASKPDLVLLDIQMPGMSGIEVMSKIKSDSETADTKILFITAFAETDEGDFLLGENYAKETGAIGHMRKTDDLDKIVKKVEGELST